MSSGDVVIHPSWDTLRNKPTDLVTSEALQFALDDRELGIHPDSDDLLEIIDGPAYGGGGSITFGTAAPSGGIDGDIYLQYEE